MSNTILEVQNLSKLYRLGEVGTGTLTHDLNRWWARVRGKEDPFSVVGQANHRDQKSKSDYVWALKDVTFRVDQGEILGILGSNGAGKSTLLKLVSRITAPTTGRIRARGRIASLLEVGTGMHPEMTARENIFLNGAILGMRRHEIRRKFDEIVEYSGCQMYLETPVKRFSSGMRVRLGFAVAAFLDAEILIVDEVLAVGDAEFQKRSSEKMKELSTQQGRTILFVSHNLTSIERLCSRAIVMESGRLTQSGPPGTLIAAYLNSFGQNSSWNSSQMEADVTRPSIRSARIRHPATGILDYGEDLTIETTVFSPHGGPLALELTVRDQFGSPVIYLPSKSRFDQEFLFSPNERKLLTCTLPQLPLASGQYSIDLTLSHTGVRNYDQIRSALMFQIDRSDPMQSGGQFSQESRQGCVHLPAEFSESIPGLSL